MLNFVSRGSGQVPGGRGGGKLSASPGRMEAGVEAPWSPYARGPRSWALGVPPREGPRATAAPGGSETVLSDGRG